MINADGVTALTVQLMGNLCNSAPGILEQRMQTPSILKYFHKQGADETDLTVNTDEFKKVNVKRDCGQRVSPAGFQLPFDSCLENAN